MRYPTLADWEQARDTDQHTKVRELLPRLDWHALWEARRRRGMAPLSAHTGTAAHCAVLTGQSRQVLLMLEIAAALSTGRKVLGHDPGRRIRVLYIDFENDPRGDVRTRLQDMGYTNQGNSTILTTCHSHPCPTLTPKPELQPYLPPSKHTAPSWSSSTPSQGPWVGKRTTTTPGSTSTSTPG